MEWLEEGKQGIWNVHTYTTHTLALCGFMEKLEWIVKNTTQARDYVQFPLVRGAGAIWHLLTVQSDGQFFK